MQFILDAKDRCRLFWMTRADEDYFGCQGEMHIILDDKDR
jgi:hypothetical protein